MPPSIDIISYILYYYIVQHNVLIILYHYIVLPEICKAEGTFSGNKEVPYVSFI